jgi:ABC-type molybdate transport system substrate-binding protein
MIAVRLLIGISVCVVIMAADLVRAEDHTLTVFAAGSLREALGAIAEDFGAAHKILIRTEFGPSGRMRERIEHGEQADLFASADIGHARTLVEQGRATVMAMFARNSICALAPAGLGLTEATIVDKLLDAATRIGISTPKVDPLGDYTAEIYHRINQEHAGAADDLTARSTVIGAPPGGPQPRSGDPFADALQDGRVGLEILYCSGRDRFARLLPAATMTPFPPALQVGPEYALAVLKNGDPLAAELALYMLSPKGQATLASSGFISVSLPQADR